jgi:hypothetical protein
MANRSDRRAHNQITLTAAAQAKEGMRSVRAESIRVWGIPIPETKTEDSHASVSACQGDQGLAKQGEPR